MASSFLNKISNKITNNTGSIIGRENLAKLSNSINRTFLSSKYREFLKPGNVVQLISKNSHMPLQICSSQNDLARLILLGNGHVGPEHSNAHFCVIKDQKSGHFKFQNGANFIALDEPGIPCVLREPTNPKAKPHEYIRSRNAFRLHEILGSEEWFALESVYFAGKYIAITPDGSITVTKDKNDEAAYFCLHLIQEHPSNSRSNRPQTTRSSQNIAASGSQDRISVGASSISSDNGQNSYNSEESRKKREESERYASEQNQAEHQPSTSTYSAPPEPDTAPPIYNSLFPTLPNS